MDTPMTTVQKWSVNVYESMNYHPRLCRTAEQTKLHQMIRLPVDLCNSMQLKSNLKYSTILRQPRLSPLGSPVRATALFRRLDFHRLQVLSETLRTDETHCTSL